MAKFKEDKPPIEGYTVTFASDPVEGGTVVDWYTDKPAEPIVVPAGTDMSIDEDGNFVFFDKTTYTDWKFWAAPASGYEFSDWKIEMVGNGPTVQGNTKITAIFKQVLPPVKYVDLNFSIADGGIGSFDVQLGDTKSEIWIEEEDATTFDDTYFGEPRPFDGTSENL